jgi:hypothetical protein
LNIFQKKGFMRTRRGLQIALALCGAATLAVSCGRSPTEPIIPTLPVVAPGTILFHDDVDTENNGVGVNNFTAFKNWVVVDGCVDLHGNGFYDVQAGNGIYIDLDGTCQKAGTIETKVAYDLTPGTYVLEFWLAGNQRIARSDTVDVSLGTVYEERFILPRTEQFRMYSRPLVVQNETSVKLRFRNHGGDHQGALLDQVRLRRAS